jgi:hypothetical protein
MRRFTSALILSIFVLLPIAARADDDDWYRRRNRDRGYYGNDPYYRNNDPYYRGNDPYGNGTYRNGRYGGGYSPVDRALQDLQGIRQHSRSNSGHFNSALDNLYRFQQKWQSGQWDRGRLDKAIENIQHLANSNDMYPRDRQMLQNDANALRSFRSSGGNGAYRNGNYGGYRNGSWWPF